MFTVGSKETVSLQPQMLQAVLENNDFSQAAKRLERIVRQVQDLKRQVIHARHFGNVIVGQVEVLEEGSLELGNLRELVRVGVASRGAADEPRSEATS